MEIQLKQLIDKIKTDGVKAAETEAAAILAAANAEAEKIVADAKAEADALLREAKEENARLTRVSEDAIRQAGRNLLISFRESVTKELSAVTGEQIKAVYDSDALAALIASVVEAWSKQGGAEEDIAVLLGEKDAEKLEASLLSALKARMLNGVTLRATDDLDSGFRIAVQGGRVYYDYSAEAVTEMLSAYLNPRVTTLLKEA